MEETEHFVDQHAIPLAEENKHTKTGRSRGAHRKKLREEEKRAILLIIVSSSKNAQDEILLFIHISNPILIGLLPP